MVTRWKGVGAWVKKGKGLRCTSWQLQNSLKDVKYGIENTVSDIVITLYGARWVRDLPGGSLRELHKCLATMCTPERNTILNVILNEDTFKKF